MKLDMRNEVGCQIDCVLEAERTPLPGSMLIIKSHRFKNFVDQASRATRQARTSISLYEFGVWHD